MARVVEGGSSVMDALVYGSTHHSVSNYIQDAYHRVSSVVNDLGRAAMDNAHKLFEKTRNNSAYRLAQAALRKLDDGFMSDTIQPLLTVAQLQNAPNVMVPWLMSEPTVKRRWLSGRCEGYGEDYTDVSKGATGVSDALWRAVHNGMVITDDDRAALEDADLAAEVNWGCITFLDDEVEELNIDFAKQVDIQRSQDALFHAVKHGVDDPTSRWNASL